MLINREKKIIILLVPRCASTSLALMYQYVKNFEYVKTKHKNEIHHHVRMIEISDIDYTEYEIFVVHRPIVEWIKSCFSFYIEYFPLLAKNYLFEEFIENNGIEQVRFTDKEWNWNWCKRSPENMIINENKEAFVCKKYHFVKMENIEDKLVGYLEKTHGIKSPKMICANHVPEHVKDKNLSKEQVEKIKNLCCPLNIIE